MVLGSMVARSFKDHWSLSLASSICNLQVANSDKYALPHSSLAELPNDSLVFSLDAARCKRNLQCRVASIAIGLKVWLWREV